MLNLLNGRMALLVAAAAMLWAAAGAAPLAQAAPEDPLFTYVPEQPPPPLPPPIPPPNEFFNGPCGVAVDAGGRFYLSDHYHDGVDVYSLDVFSGPSRDDYLTQLQAPDEDAGPCAVAVEPAGDVYVADYHGAVRKYTPDVYPPEAGADPPDTGTPYTAEALVDPGIATGLAFDPATGEVYVAHRDRVSVYDSAGAFQRNIGVGDLEEGYGVAVSAHPATEGWVYVADAASGTVKVFDAAGDPLPPLAGPPGGFSSLRDASLALDQVSGELYVVDDTQPVFTEQRRARVHVFAADGSYEGHLKYDVVDGLPTGLTVDNSGGATQGRVYVTSGDTLPGGLYVYPPGAATADPPLTPTIPPPPIGGGLPVTSIEIGAPATGVETIPCTGDSCRRLPPQPVDPTLTTLLEGPGNPTVRYRRYKHRKKRKQSRHRRCRRQHRRACRHSGRRAAASTARTSQAGGGGAPAAANAGVAGVAAPAGIGAQGLLPGVTGFAADIRADGGEPATQAGSHPYRLALNVALNQSGGGADLRDLGLDLPAGLLANPAAIELCSSALFATPRSSPFEASASGESCPDATQIGTIEVTTGAGGGETRRFGLFSLTPAEGTAARFGAAPFGRPLVFNVGMRAGGASPFGLTLQATDVPTALAAHDLDLVLWGTPWGASHDGERGDCLNEAEPGFAWSKCSVGEPLNNRPLAFLTLPTECDSAPVFTARVRSWQQADTESRSEVNRDAEGDPALLDECETLDFNPNPQAFLTTAKASSPSGLGFRLTGSDAGLLDPAARVSPPPRRIVLRLPAGATINPSAGAGLGVCTPAQLAAESAFNPPGAGCPNDSKLGDFRLQTPTYKGFLDGAVYLAQPDDPATTAPGAENPSDTLVAAYLVAKSAQRGILVRVAGQIAADPGSGDLTAIFEDLPQLPYTDLQVDLHPGQRSILVSPPACGPAVTRTRVTPWAGPSSETLGIDELTTWQIESGIDGGPCPDGSTPPFAPNAIAGGVNSNVNSYTPYFVHLQRKDTEQEITSYSLVLPEGITGKLAGIPFCADAAIAAARANSGAAETARPSCPAASQVGRTETGYGVGAALSYASGRIYLAGPYHGSPLSLVTVNPATVGPFDLGTVVVRSAFDVDPLTAQLRIDSSASDPIPHIIAGVPLRLRDVRVYIDRPEFTHNPSSCEASQLISTLTGSGAALENPKDDSTATLTKHFQLLNCLSLGFRPKLGLRLRGSPRRGGFPELRATFASRGPRDSNLKRIEVDMPRQLFLAQNHIGTVCTRAQFAAERCPPGSVYGRAVAYSPLLDQPLRGEVYLRSSDNKLPDLVTTLRSGSIRIDLAGRIGPTGKGGIQAFFDNLPDAPINRFTMVLHGGRRGLLVNSVNVCKRPPTALVKALGQNNIGAIFTSELRGKCHHERRRR